MVIDLNVLKTELDTDPELLGYSGMNDETAAIKLNEVGASGEIIDNDIIESYKIINAVTTTPLEYTALPAADRDLIQLITSSQFVDIKDAGIKSAISAMFGVGTDARTALLELTTRAASRAEVLYGNGVRVSLIEVHKARRI